MKQYFNIEWQTSLNHVSGARIPTWGLITNLFHRHEKIYIFYSSRRRHSPRSVFRAQVHFDVWSARLIQVVNSYANDSGVWTESEGATTEEDEVAPAHFRLRGQASLVIAASPRKSPRELADRKKLGNTLLIVLVLLPIV